MQIIMNRGRPRQFEEDEIIEQVMASFRRHGYEGTTFDQLVADSGLSRSSLRNAFGDKEELFDRALRRYSDRLFFPMLERLDDVSCGDDLLRTMVKKMSNPVDAGATDCLLFLTMLYNATGISEPKHPRRVANHLQRLWRSIGNALGCIRPKRTKKLSTDERAAILVGLIYGVKLISRNGRNKELVNSIAEGAAKLVEGK